MDSSREAKSKKLEHDDNYLIIREKKTLESVVSWSYRFVEGTKDSPYIITSAFTKEAK
jgi:hypothetical protein